MFEEAEEYARVSENTIANPVDTNGVFASKFSFSFTGQPSPYR
jgi:hypothetical protein